MNRFAYLTTGYAIRTLSGLSKARVRVHGADNIPDQSLIFVINHFTRIETLILPGYIYELTGRKPVWSLADASLFQGTLKSYLDSVGAVSTRDPDRDLLIVRTLVTGEASWIIFPEGRMVKSKKVFDRGRFMTAHEMGLRPPHTGAATLALRSEFYRRRLSRIQGRMPEETARLAELFNIEDLGAALEKKTCIVPVNITYYPMRAHENILSKTAGNLFGNLPARALEELMAEGTMLLSGVDIDIRFGRAIDVGPYLDHPAISQDIEADREIGFDDRLPSEKRLRKAAGKIMQRYMKAIYEMTTVNHDHLFASILKMTPYQRMNEEDLRRRVFLAAGAEDDFSGFSSHSSLMADQTHLLTDDRYHKFRDFIKMAMSRGVIRKEGDDLVKEAALFAASFDFHRVRVLNPVTVIANEVEPLTKLRRQLRRLAWMPAFMIQKKTVRRILETEEKTFGKDYDDYFIEGETKPKKVGRPFLVKGRRRDVGVLLLHGYMSAPLQMAGLAASLGDRGIPVYVPRIKGHGTSPPDLAERKYTDWIESAERGYALIRNLCRKVVVGGFSTGAALAMKLAQRRPEPAGVFAVCPPRRLDDPSMKRNMAMDIWKKVVDRVRGNDETHDFVEFTPENADISYHRNPVTGIREIELLMDGLEPDLEKITAPSMIVHSENDPVADPEYSRKIFEKIGSREKTYTLFNFRRHIIVSGEGSEKVYRVIGDFIEHIIG